ncbi:tyrosine-type recombinase/integrase, partial [Achromobacter sp. GG226]|uniref:tyrosine-type recombinase/integrase n=1 Tax=Verticiella alkaliphila TaxID=2779529 RepID=UPI001C0E32FA
MSCWRSFYGWLARREPIAVNPADGLRAPKAPRGLPKAMSVEQTAALLEHAGAPVPDSAEARRHACDRAMFELLYSSGLRLAELVGLDAAWTQTPAHTSAGWLNLAEREVHVLGKGGKRRSVPVGEKAVDALSAWIALRPQIARPGDAQRLFVRRPRRAHRA